MDKRHYQAELFSVPDNGDVIKHVDTTKPVLDKLSGVPPLKVEPKAIDGKNKKIADASGNIIAAVYAGDVATISLQLAYERRSRKLGSIILSDRVFVVKRQRKKHLFRRFNAYGLNYMLLKDAKLFDHVRIIDETEEWLIPVPYILEYGRMLHFEKSGGFELQIFIPLDSITRFIAPL